MFNVNEYFDGNVKSIGVEDKEGKATIGAMAIGEYEFGTSTIEYMTVVSGALTVLLPNEKEWKTYKPFETFIVQANQKFKVKIDEASTYICRYK